MKGADIFFGLSAKGALTPGHGQKHGARSDHFRDGESRSGDHAGRREEGARRRDHRDRPLRLSQPGQQRPRISLYFPRRARRARQDDQHGDEDRRGARARRPRARGRSRRSGGGLSRREAALRPRLHHSGSVRSAPHSCRADRGRQGRDGLRGRAAADRRSRRLQGAIVGPSRPDRRRDAAHHRARPPHAQTRRVRRRRGRAGDPRRLFLRQSGPWRGDSGRPRRARARASPRRRVSIFRTRASRFTTPASRSAIRFTPNSSTSGCSGRAICSAIASA